MPSNIMARNSTDFLGLKKRDWFNLSILTHDLKTERKAGVYYSMIAKQSLDEPKVLAKPSPKPTVDTKKASIRLIKAASVKERRGTSAVRSSSIEDNENSTSRRASFKKKSLSRLNNNNQANNTDPEEKSRQETEFRNFYDYFLNNDLTMYQIIRTIGTGNFSKVKLASHVEDKKFYAIKIIDKTKLNESAQRLLSQEISILYRLQHPNIIKLIEHSKNVVHRDIKGDNILFVNKLPEDGYRMSRLRGENSNFSKRRSVKGSSTITRRFFNGNHGDPEESHTFYKIKLADFGFSKEAKNNDSLTTFCGSPAYAAPELFHSKSYDGRKVDIWALGVTLHFLVLGKLPFIGSNVTQLKHIIMNFVQFQERLDISTDLNRLISRLLVKNPKDRLPITTRRYIEKVDPDCVPKWGDYLNDSVVVQTKKKSIGKLTKSPSCNLSQIEQRNSPREEKATVSSFMRIRQLSRKKLNIFTQ